MTLSTLLRYLIGDRQAIFALTANRRALWIGLVRRSKPGEKFGVS
jgi:hypothetical protein